MCVGVATTAKYMVATLNICSPLRTCVYNFFKIQEFPSVSFKNRCIMGKIKQEPVEQGEGDVSVKTETISYDDKVEHCSVIAKPMAPKKLSKKIYKLIKKSSSHKNYIRNGLKLVQKQLRLGEKGIVVFAGDISPIEIMCHLPGVCEEKDVPYCYTPSRKDIGAAMGTMRGCIMILVKEHEDYKDLYDEVKSEIKLLGHPI